MGKKKHDDSEASGSVVKKEMRLHRVPLPVDMAWVLQENWVTCNRWGDIPPVPRRESERSAEIRRGRRYLPLDLRDNPAFPWSQINDTHDARPRRKAGFLGDRDFLFERPPPPRR
jgi:hypothetical protein